MSYNDKVVHHREPLLDRLWVNSDEEKLVEKKNGKKEGIKEKKEPTSPENTQGSKEA